MQAELKANFPSLDIQLIGVNESGYSSGNENITAGRNIPWLQDVDADGDGNSDVWDDWEIAYRDVAIVDEENELIDIFNLTDNDITRVANYDSLKQTLTAAAATPQATPWQSPIEPLDVNADGSVAPLDALLIINDLNTYAGGQLPDSTAGQEPYIDPTGDGIVSPLDALSVINQLNRNAQSVGIPPASALSSSVDTTLPAADNDATASAQPLAEFSVELADDSESRSQAQADTIDYIFAVQGL